MTAALLEAAVERQRLNPGSGVSGHVLELVTLADGRSYVVKHLRPRETWQMRVTGDPGVRDALLWERGVLARAAHHVDHAVVSVERHEDEVVVIMRDVSDALLPKGGHIPRAAARRALVALDRLHHEFRGEAIQGLSTLEDRYRLLSPNALRGESDDPSPIPAAALAGWDAFPRLVPRSVADDVLAVLDDPARLAGPLSDRPCTLIHGDAHLANIGITDREIVLLDWGELTTLAPSTVEFAYFLVMRDHHGTIDATNDELCADYRAIAAEDCDERAFALAMFGSLVMFGWSMALRMQLASTDAERAAARHKLDYWCMWAAQARRWWRPR